VVQDEPAERRGRSPESDAVSQNRSDDLIDFVIRPER
jgi:hypothetical protein